jgi:hypothetical protein
MSLDAEKFDELFRATLSMFNLGQVDVIDPEVISAQFRHVLDAYHQCEDKFKLHMKKTSTSSKT